MTFTGRGLPASANVTLVWMTASVRYMLDPKPDSVDYIGRKVDKVGVALATSKTDAAGALSIKVKAPVDYGGLHDVYAVVDGQQVAKGGFLLERTVTIRPKKGPLGTPITGQGRGHGLADVRERRSGALRQQVHGRRLGQHDARDCGLQAPRCRRGGGALDRVRRIQSHRALPEHGAVPGAVDG